MTRYFYWTSLYCAFWNSVSQWFSFYKVEWQHWSGEVSCRCTLYLVCWQATRICCAATTCGRSCWITSDAEAALQTATSSWRHEIASRTNGGDSKSLNVVSVNKYHSVFGVTRHANTSSAIDASPAAHRGSEHRPTVSSGLPATIQDTITTLRPQNHEVFISKSPWDISLSLFVYLSAFLLPVIFVVCWLCHRCGVTHITSFVEVHRLSADIWRW